MQPTAHIDFIAAAYAAAAIVVSVLIAWVTLDYRAQNRKIADLELEGITRRSDVAPTHPAQLAKEAATVRAEEQA